VEPSAEPWMAILLRGYSIHAGLLGMW
jgi:hypothetical protein